MEELLTRIWTDLGGRIGGPLTLRFFLQPAMATLFAIRDGVKDAQHGRPAYFWTIFTDPESRRSLLQEGWAAVAKVFTLAIVLDVIYQFMQFRWLYPFEAVIVAVMLALVPYLLLRGPVNRLVRAWLHRRRVA